MQQLQRCIQTSIFRRSFLRPLTLRMPWGPLHCACHGPRDRASERICPTGTCPNPHLSHRDVAALQKQSAVVSQAADEIRSSRKLARVLEYILALGNALNRGTSRAEVLPHPHSAHKE